MTIEEEIFQKTKIDFAQIEKYGFQKVNDLYQYSTNIMNDTFKITIQIDLNGKVKGEIYDLSFQEEYLNFRRDDGGSFIGKVREEFERILNDIKNKCFMKEPFLFEQSNRIARSIQEKYGDEPQFEWDKFPGYATFRNPDNHKWYAIIMNIDKSKLNKKESGEVEIIDMKLDPNEIQKLLKQNGFYPAYHMNKKNWITILLNNTVSDSIIIDLLDKSYSYTVRKENENVKR